MKTRINKQRVLICKNKKRNENIKKKKQATQKKCVLRKWTELRKKGVNERDTERKREKNSNSERHGLLQSN